MRVCNLLLLLACLVPVLPLSAQSARYGGLQGFTHPPANVVWVQAVRQPLRYRSAQWQTSPPQWGADSILGYAEEIVAGGTQRIASVRYSTGDSIYKAAYQYDAQARKVFGQEYERAGTIWRISYEERYTYGAGGRLVEDYSKSFNSSGQPTTWSQRQLYLFDNLGRQVAYAWYSWRNTGWRLEDSVVTRYSNRAGIPDTTFTNSSVRKLHYTGYPLSYEDTLLVTQLFNNNVWQDNSYSHYRNTPALQYTYQESYHPGVRRIVPHSQRYYYPSDTLVRYYEMAFHHGRRDSSLKQRIRYDGEYRLRLNESSSFDTTAQRWNLNYASILYEDQGGITSRVLYWRGTDYANPIPVLKYDYFGPVAVQAALAPTLQVWPTPASGEVWVEASGRVEEATLVDVNGQKGVKGNLLSTGAFFDLKGLSPGIYLARVRTAAGMAQVRIVKE